MNAIEIVFIIYGMIAIALVLVALKKIDADNKRIKKRMLKETDVVKIENKIIGENIDNAINNIKADLDEAEEFALEYSSDLIQAFQQGRIYADRFALIQIERLICERRKTE